jgi:hypothetical protein
MLATDPVVTTLYGADFGACRGLSSCCAEHTFRACGMPNGLGCATFGIVGLMSCHPLLLCCVLPCSKAGASRAHMIELRETSLDCASAAASTRSSIHLAWRLCYVIDTIRAARPPRRCARA